MNPETVLAVLVGVLVLAYVAIALYITSVSPKKKPLLPKAAYHQNLGRAGDSQRKYTPKRNLNRLINRIGGGEVKAFFTSVLITQQKQVPDTSFYQGLTSWDVMRSKTDAIGCDLSRYNVSFDPTQATAPIDFAFQKATEGLSYVDLKYEEIWQGVKQIPVRGAYHYQRSGLSWIAQADHALETFAKHDYHIYALDVEEYGNTYNDTYFVDCKRVIDYWRKNCDRAVMLYTNGNTYTLMYAALARTFGASYTAEWMNGTELWLASPGVPAGIPVLPKGRTTWTIHQYTWGGLCTRWGTGSGSVDENVYNGSVADLYSRFRDDTPPPTEPPIENEEPMQGTVKTLTNIRADRNKNSSDMGDLLTGDLVEWSTEWAGLDGLTWLQLTKATRNGAPVLCTDGSTAVGKYAWKNNVEVIVTPPVDDGYSATFDGTFTLTAPDGKTYATHIIWDVPLDPQ